MGATGIEWTRGPNGEQGYTFNPWIGCTKISGACDNCYAETASVKFGSPWGPHADRRPISESTWSAPLAWDRAAAKAGERRRVFCASMADVLDNHKSIDFAWRERLYALIAATPNLDWMLLTKRPMNAKKLLPYGWFVRGGWPRNCWFGFTAETQVTFNHRWMTAKEIPAPLIFVSAEPLLEAYELPTDASRIGLFIVGGESGRLVDIRETPRGAFRSMQRQCAHLNIPFFMKQLDQIQHRGFYKKFDRFPHELQIREQPRLVA